MKPDARNIWVGDAAGTDWLAIIRSSKNSFRGAAEHVRPSVKIKGDLKGPGMAESKSRSED